MSLVNAWTDGKRGFMATDTALLNHRDGGRALGFASKAFPLKEIPAVVTSTFIGGPITVWAEEFFEAERSDNIATFRATMSEACRHGVEKSHKEGFGESFARFVAVAWCAIEQKPRIFHCCSADEIELGHGVAYTVVEMDFILGSGAGDPVVEAARDSLKAGRGLATNEEILDLCDAQRHAPFLGMETGVPSPFLSIGGHVELRTVTSEGVDAATIGEWPDDKVGFPLGEACDPNKNTA